MAELIGFAMFFGAIAGGCALTIVQTPESDPWWLYAATLGATLMMMGCVGAINARRPGGVIRPRGRPTGPPPISRAGTIDRVVPADADLPTGGITAFGSASGERWLRGASCNCRFDINTETLQSIQTPNPDCPVHGTTKEAP